MFANARMYAVSPPVAAAWRALLEWVVARAGVACDVIDYPPPQPLAALWSRRDMACAFMCGRPLSLASPRPWVLAAPVPRAAGCHGEPVYWTDIVVRADAPARSLDEIFGQRFAYTTEDSQSGYHAPRALFAPFARARGAPLFAATVGPLVTPRAVIDSVLGRAADAGPLDSYVHDLIRAHEPALAAQLRTVASTPPTPIPPLVAAPAIGYGTVERLRGALLAAADEPTLAPVLGVLRLARFAEIPSTSYDALQRAARSADATGYRRLE